jgi:hypothetical protein
MRRLAPNMSAGAALFPQHFCRNIGLQARFCAIVKVNEGKSPKMPDPLAHAGPHRRFARARALLRMRDDVYAVKKEIVTKIV